MSTKKPVPHKELTELQKWNLVNDACSFEELQSAIRDVSDEEGNIASKTSGWHYENMTRRLWEVHRGADPVILTRAYGIRSRALALLATYNLTFREPKNVLPRDNG